MWSLLRFRTDAADFEEEARSVVEWWRGRRGCMGLDLVRSLDDPELWALIGQWSDVGSYRRSFTGTEAKVVLTGLLSRCIDEPSTFLAPHELRGDDATWG